MRRAREGYCATAKRSPGILQKECFSVHAGRRGVSQALEDSPRQRFRFFDARRFRANAADTDAQEGLTLEHVERAGDRVTHPVGFLAEAVDEARFALPAFGFRLICGIVVSAHFFFPQARRMKLLPPELARSERGEPGRV